MAKRGPKLLPTVKNLIASEAISYPGKPREVLAVEIREEIAHMDIMGERELPSKDYVMRLISKFRNKEVNPIDNPWSMMSVDQYPDLFPADAIPFVLQAWVYLREHREVSLTVRQAKWVARLCRAIKDLNALVSEAVGYAQIELITDILPGNKIETHGADLDLFEMVTGEQLSDKRRSQILGVSRESVEDYGADSPFERNKLHMWLEAYNFIMRAETSNQSFRKRLEKLQSIFPEVKLELPEEPKEEK